MKKTEERKTFNAYRSQMIGELGRKATTDAQLDKIGQREFGPAWGGVWPQDKLPLKPNKSYIANTDTSDKPGSHWIAVHTTGSNVYIWDSYGRDAARVAKHITKKIKSSGFGSGATNLDPQMEQIGYSSAVCGPLSLSWLLTVRDLGIRKAANI